MDVFVLKNNIYFMKNYKFLLVTLLLVFCQIPANADDIDIASFRELMESAPASGDTLNFTDDLSSDETIGRHFYNIDITFDGNSYYINGNEDFGGFVLNRESTFKDVGIRNCQGQEYNRSYFAGAI